MTARSGVALFGKEFGVSVWVGEDGSLVNAYAHYATDCPGSHWRQRYEAAQEYIEQHQKKEAA